MGWFDFILPKTQPKQTQIEDSIQVDEPNARMMMSYRWGAGFTVRFDGEKNLGELGPVLNYLPDYRKLRARSWQLYLESDISKTVFNKFSKWVIGSGLKLQASPIKVLLRDEGINFDPEQFNEICEARFLAWSRSVKCSHDGSRSLNRLAQEAFKHGKIGGDCLVTVGFNGIEPTVRVIDGDHVQNPISMPEEYKLANIVDGIEYDENGKEIAYWVNTMDGAKRFPAYSETGLRLSWMYYGDVYRLDSTRGIPLIATSMETIKKIDRYKEAAVGSAEERQKIVYQIEHEIGSSGESPLIQSIASAFDADGGNGGKDSDKDMIDVQGERLRKDVAATTNKQVFNMPQGAKLSALESRNEMFFTEFYQTNANIICAAMGIPPNVAFSMYTDSFSASRAATKDWDHTITVERADFQEQFYQPIYEFWLHIQILKGKIQLPGYLSAFNSGDFVLLSAFQNSRFTGPMFPHIDPLKEVEAERRKLGKTADNIPLTTVEQATEALNSGDSDSNIEQYSEELKTAIDLKIALDPTAPIQVQRVTNQS
jgi:capsid protein